MGAGISVFVIMFICHFKSGYILSVVSCMPTNSDTFLAKLYMSIVHQSGKHTCLSVCSVELPTYPSNHLSIYVLFQLSTVYTNSTTVPS